MSTDAPAQAPGAAAPGTDPDSADSLPDPAGSLLRRLSVLPALLAMGWLLAGLPLLLAGQFRPAWQLAAAIPVMLLLAAAGLRWSPGWPRSARAASGQPRTPWWAVAGVVAVAAAFGIDQLLYHSQFIIVMRDPGAYVQFATWISRHGSLPVPSDAAAFGGTHGGALSFNSFASYQSGGALVPQFMAGLPMVVSAAFWAGGVKAAVLVSPVIGAAGVLAFGGLVARLAGPRWAPLGALVLALTLPEQFTSRSDYSEPLAQVLFLGGLCLVIDSLGSRGARSRIIAALGGLAFGLTLLVRIDGASDMLPVIPYCGLLALQRRSQALPLLGGLVAGVACGAADGFALTYPYLDSLRPVLVPLGIAAAGVTVITAATVALLWRRGLPAWGRGWLPAAAAVVAVVVPVAFTLRPYVQTVRSATVDMSGYQRGNHLPVDPTRVYYEQSMHWVFWYIGVPAVVAAALGAAILARRCLRGSAGTFVLPLAAFAWIIVTALYDPAITPDQPWASRRLVPAVLPGFILLAIWGLSWIAARLRGVTRGRALTAVVSLVCAAALLAPAVVTTYGLHLTSGGPGGVRLTADGVAAGRTYQGEIAALRQLCAAIPRDSSVVILDPTTAGWFTGVVRGTCGVPAAHMTSADPSAAAVRQVIGGIAAAGRRPVLLAGAPLARSGVPHVLARYPAPRLVMLLHTRQDPATLLRPPTGTTPFSWAIWMAQPQP